jgi:hypothetical protein
VFFRSVSYVYQNSLASIPVGLLDSLTALQNMWGAVPVLSAKRRICPELLRLFIFCSDLSHNQLTVVPSGFFANLTSLQQV